MHQTHIQRFATIRCTMPVVAILCAGIFASSAHAQCETWLPLGTGVNQAIGSLASNGNDLIVTGSFTQAGGISANHVARWDSASGGTWHPMHTGVNNTVQTLTMHNGQPVIGGDFTLASGQSANRIARWNGVFWQPMSSGMNATVLALHVYNGQVVAGGEFTQAGNVSANRIARWTGGFWEPLGPGLNGPVFAMAEYQGDLIVGGAFTAAGNVQVANIARWDGSNWHALGGANGVVSALTVYNNELIAAGGFSSIGGQPANNIARWNGASGGGGWQPLGGGIGGAALSLAEYAGELYAGGMFQTAGMQPAFAIARWNGADWHSVGADNVNHNVYGLAVHNNELIIGGSFISAGALTLNRIARLRRSPMIADAPLDVIAAEGETAIFSVTLMNPQAGPFTYTWRKGGVPLVDGNGISGASTDTLTISSIAAIDFGAYDIRVSSSCGSVTSAPAALAITAAPPATCPGDLNFDGAVNVSDLLLLFSQWGVCP